MGMYLHIDIQPTNDVNHSMVQAWANYVDHNGKAHIFKIFNDQVVNKEYSDARPIEHWVISTMANISSAVSSAMTGQIVRGEVLLIPSESEQQLF